MSRWEKQRQALQQQLDAAPWLKWAGVAIAVLLAMFLLQSVEQWRTERQKAAIEAELNLKRILGLKGQDIWLEREQAANTLHTALLAQLPEVATPGQAQAALQNWLKTATAPMHTEQNPVTLRVNRFGPVEGMPGIVRVNAALNVATNPRQALSLLRRIETATNLITVESLTIKSDSSNTLHLTLNAYYRVPNEAAP